MYGNLNTIMEFMAGGQIILMVIEQRTQEKMALIRQSADVGKNKARALRMCVDEKRPSQPTFTELANLGNSMKKLDAVNVEDVGRSGIRSEEFRLIPEVAGTWLPGMPFSNKEQIEAQFELFQKELTIRMAYIDQDVEQLRAQYSAPVVDEFRKYTKEWVQSTHKNNYMA